MPESNKDLFGLKMKMKNNEKWKYVHLWDWTPQWKIKQIEKPYGTEISLSQEPESGNLYPTVLFPRYVTLHKSLQFIEPYFPCLNNLSEGVCLI